MKLLSVSDVAESWGVSDQLIYDLVDQKKIVHHRIGNGRGCIRFAQADVDAYLAENRVEVEEMQTARKVAPSAKREWF